MMMFGAILFSSNSSSASDSECDRNWKLNPGQRCREPLTTHKSTVWNHFACKNTKTTKKIFELSGVKRQQILDSIVEYQKVTDVVGVKTLTEEEKIFRYDVLYSFLSSLDPLQSPPQAS